MDFQDLYDNNRLPSPLNYSPLLSPSMDSSSSIFASPLRPMQPFTPTRTNRHLSLTPVVSPAKNTRSGSYDLELPSFNEIYLQSLTPTESLLFRQESAPPSQLFQEAEDPPVNSSALPPPPEDVGKENDEQGVDPQDEELPDINCGTPSSSKSCERRKRTPSDKATTRLFSRRAQSGSEKRRRTKACCIRYPAHPDLIPSVLEKLSYSANPQRKEMCSSVFVTISHFMDPSHVPWVVFVVKEAIPISNWLRICELTGGLSVCLNPPVDPSRKLATVFEGVVQNFPSVTVNLLNDNRVSERMLIQVFPQLDHITTPQANHDMLCLTADRQARC